MAAVNNLDDNDDIFYHVIRIHTNDAPYSYHGRPVTYGDIRAFVIAAFVVGAIVSAAVITSVLTW